jgi:hypothetical protein
MLSRAKFSEKPISTTTTKEKLDVLMHACYPNYGGRQRLAKRAGVMAQVVECLLSKLEYCHTQKIFDYYSVGVI